MPRLISATQHELVPDSAPVSSARTAESSDQLLQLRGYEVGGCVGGKYTLLELLGEGGMGSVWRAHNELLDVDVALKLIRSEELEAPDGTLLGDRLLQEARAAARLGHPAIARVFDFGMTDRNNPYIVMELLRGEDLGQALARRGRTSAVKAVTTLMPIAHALAAAHSQGIVHRDLKPENIFLSRSEDGRVVPKLVDFGIAKIDRGKSHRLTQTGTMLGSPIYMSPEQARGDDVDHRADIWALCVVLYEMVSGHPPFEGRNYNALLYAIIADNPTPVSADIAGDDELWEILQRGFEKERERRWPSMDALGRALAQWLIVRGVHEDLTGASLVAQWFRAAPAGDILTSMLPQPMEHVPMPRIPGRAERARWAAETRTSEARNSRGTDNRFAAVSSLLNRGRALCVSWLRTLRVGDKLAVPAFALLAQRPRALLFGALGSSLGGALVVGVFASGHSAALSVTEPMPMDTPVQVSEPLSPAPGDTIVERVEALLRPAVEVQPEVIDVLPPPPLSEVPEVKRVRRAGPRPTSSSRLKNPFD